MSGTTEFSQTLSRYLRARIPFVSVRTHERPRALELIRAELQSIGLTAYVHTLSQGTRDMATGRVLNDDRSPLGALDFAASQLAARQNLSFVLTEAKDLADDSPLARQLLDLALMSSDRGGMVIVITAGSVWTPLQRVGVAVTLSPPDEDELLGILHDTIDAYRSSIPVEWAEPEFRKAASILHGLTRMEAENVIATVIAGGAVRLKDMDELVRAKDRLFSDISGIERVDAERVSADVGGLEGLRAWFERERPLLMADMRARQLRPPRGALLVGVPGCGKSLSAKFVARSWGVPLYRLDLANIHGMYLGQSESRLKEALASADHVAPCVLWIDEIEKGLSGAMSGMDGGASTRLVGHFLYWLQEARSRVFVVATANDVSHLPPELLRRGRFDEIFFVDLPIAEERLDIISLYVKRNLKQTLPADFIAELVEMSEGFAGADLEAAVREVAKDAHLHGEQAVTPDAFRRRFANIVPFSKTSPERVEAIRAWGRERALPASGHPIGGSETERRPGRAVLV